MALQAADVTRAKLRVRHAVDGAAKVVPETLPEVRDAVAMAIESVGQSLRDKAAPLASAQDALVPAPVQVEAVSSVEMDGLAKAMPIEAVVEVGVPTLVTPPAPEPATAPQVAHAATAAVVAVRAVHAGGMFGSVANKQRSAAELDDVNMVDDVFMDSEGENLVAG
jgi:hypothetical protein